MVNETNENNSKTNEKKTTYHLINAMEEIVIQKAKETIIYDQEICKCEKCFYDICAITLNALKPRYSTTDVGGLYARALNLDITETIHISVEIAKAIEMVKRRPGH